MRRSFNGTGSEVGSAGGSESETDVFKLVAKNAAKILGTAADSKTAATT